MTNSEARKKSICRICFHPIKLLAPARVFDWYKDLDWPEKITLNYGKEFAHTDCLPRATEPEIPEDLF